MLRSIASARMSTRIIWLLVLGVLLALGMLTLGLEMALRVVVALAPWLVGFLAGVLVVWSRSLIRFWLASSRKRTLSRSDRGGTSIENIHTQRPENKTRS